MGSNRGRGGVRVYLGGLARLTSAYVLANVAMDGRPPEVFEYLFHHSAYSWMASRPCVMILLQCFLP